MSQTTHFDWLATALEKHAGLNHLSARGVLRLTLQDARLDPETLTRQQLTGLLDDALPKRLERQGVADSSSICEKILQELEAVPVVARRVERLTVFEWLATAIEHRTGLDRLPARGTLRLALKGAGLIAEELTAEQAAALARHLLSSFLEKRGIANAAEVCGAIQSDLEELGSDAFADTQETAVDIARRLGSRPPGRVFPIAC